MIDPPKSTLPAEAESQDGQRGWIETTDVTGKSPDGKRTFSLEEVEQLEIGAAMMYLAFLPRTKHPRTGAAVLKHRAEEAMPTVFGYVSEKNLLEAARRLGIPINGGDVAVKLPRPPRNTHRRNCRR